MQSTAESILVIILGASEYPRMPGLSNKAFLNSAAGFKEYVLNRDGFSLPSNNLLDLFNSSVGPDEQNNQIGIFLEDRIKELNESNVAATDLILYYVGHGTFVDPGNRYVLALRNIRDGNEDISGFPMRSLANTLKESAAFLRRYLILDCCFSAAAFEAFQAVGPLELARQKTYEQLPSKGTAMLCASGPRDAAKAPSDLKQTMFSGALLEILETGSADLPERFSLADLGRNTQEMIRARFTDRSVRPQILSPDQSIGDIATLPIFPNLGLSVKALRQDFSRFRAAFREDLARLEERILSQDLSSFRAAIREDLSRLEEKVSKQDFLGFKATFTESLSRLEEKVLDPDFASFRSTMSGDLSSLEKKHDSLLRDSVTRDELVHLKKEMRDLASQNSEIKAAVNDLASSIKPHAERSDANDSGNRIQLLPSGLFVPRLASEWEALPDRIKLQVLNYQKKLRNGRIWLFACMVIVALTWACAIAFYLGSRVSSGLATIGADITLLFSYINLIFFYLIILTGFLSLLLFVFRKLTGGKDELQLRQDEIVWAHDRVTIKALQPQGFFPKASFFLSLFLVYVTYMGTQIMSLITR